MRIWKKVLSVVLVVVMCVLCWIRVAPQRAEAAGGYDVKITLDTADFKSKWNFASVVKIDMPIKLVAYGSGVEPIQSTETYSKEVVWKNISYPSHIYFIFEYIPEITTAYGFTMAGIPSIPVTIYAKSHYDTEYAKVQSFTINSSNIRSVYSGDFPLGDLVEDALGIANIGSVVGSFAKYEATHEAKVAQPNISAQGFPEGYDYGKDRWIFQNPNDNIDKSIYQEAFGNIAGNRIYNQREKDLLGKLNPHGLCYGLSGTMALFWEHKDLINAFKKENQLMKSLSSVARYALLNGYNSVTYGLNLEKLVKIAFISQYDDSVCEEIEDNRNNVKRLCDAVKKYIKGTGQAFHIYLDKGKFETKHAVSPLGIVESGDYIIVYVYDTNYPSAGIADNKIIIKSDYSSWSYTAKDYAYSSSEGHDISYNYPSDLLYNVLQIYAGRQRTSKTNPTFASDKKLIVTDKELTTVSELTYINNFAADNIARANENQNSMYWCKGDEEIIVSSKENANITICDAESSVTATVPANKEAVFIVDDDLKNSFACDFDENEKASISFEFADSDGEIIDIAISGTASDTQITATQTDTGLVVTGIDNGKITLTQNEEVIATKRITEATGDVEITYDATGETTDLDAQFPHECDDYNHNGKCDICTEVMEAVKNCDCMCHKSGFMSLVYAFVNLFWRLFGTNKACECGVHHW